MELLEWIEINEQNSQKKITEHKYFSLFFVGAISLISLIFGIIYVLLSKTVYFWDDATYWDIGRLLAEKPFGLTFLKDVYSSIGTSDYNYLVAIPVAIWMKAFGITRVSYIISIIIFYLIPSEVMIYSLAKKLSKVPEFAFVTTILAIPSLWYITSIGFIDIAGVFIGLVCYYLYMTNVLDNKKYLKNILLGALLVLMMVMRRYFAFFAVSFITVSVIDSVIFKRNIKEMACMLLSVVLILLVFFYPFFKNILLKDYGTLYSSYRYDLWTDLKLITRYFGTFFVLVVLVGGVQLIAKKRDLMCGFAILQMIVCAAMFVSTQTHGQQHLLLYIPGLVMVFIRLTNAINKKRFLIFVCLLTIFNAISPCIGRVQPNNIREIKTLAMFPSYSVKPKKRNDINSILALKRTLDKKIPEGTKCGVLSSSFVINSSILINVVPSLNMKEERTDNYIVGLPEVDSRDYWRLNEIYECDYILVATPAQTHLASGEQTIITETVKSFEDGTDIADAFSQVMDFKMKVGEITLKLYKRSMPVSETAKTEFQMKLYK